MVLGGFRSFHVLVTTYCKLERDLRYFDVNHVTSLVWSSDENFAGSIFSRPSLSMLLAVINCP